MPRGSALAAGLPASQLSTHETTEALVAVPGYGGGPPPPSIPQPPVSNARMGMLMLIGAETMFFAGLIGAYVVFRFGSPVWPSGHLYLPVGITWVNTGFLLFSCYTMWKAKCAA